MRSVVSQWFFGVAMLLSSHASGGGRGERAFRVGTAAACRHGRISASACGRARISVGDGGRACMCSAVRASRLAR